MAIKIDGDGLSLEQFDQVARGEKRVELSSAAVAKIKNCQLLAAAEKSGLRLR